MFERLDFDICLTAVYWRLIAHFGFAPSSKSSSCGSLHHPPHVHPSQTLASQPAKLRMWLIAAPPSPIFTSRRTSRDRRNSAESLKIAGKPHLWNTLPLTIFVANTLRIFHSLSC